ncbi:MAG: orotidine-5'-phosphate decarboxylase [Candidatus Hydrothermarchaeota archaeon]|nr:orotidine-5'-phosphate decarboxylase [Candidatus Hydrothermarchaeota archaeon]
MQKNNRIILALDVESEEKALQICEEVAEYIDAIKVGYPLVLKTDLSIIKKLKNFKKPVIADFKAADIPEISRKICEIATKSGADYVIVHGFAGEDVVRACSEVAKIFVVAEMSHPGAKDFMSSEAEKIAGIARKYACGIVAPATRPERIRKLRKIAGKGTVIISPGVKAQGAAVGDAIKAGADFEIIGRGIYASQDPKKAAQEFADILKKL